MHIPNKPWNAWEKENQKKYTVVIRDPNLLLVIDRTGRQKSKY